MSVPFRWENSIENTFRGVSLQSAKEKLQPSRQQCDNPALALREEPKPSLSSTSSSSMNGHQELLSRWLESKLTRRKGFGMIEWGAVRKSASFLLLKHAAVAGWKHCALSVVEQGGLSPMPKYRGAEQGNVDGPSSSLGLGMVAAEARTLGSVRTTQWKNTDIKLNKTARCSGFKTFRSVVRENILELTTRDRRCMKTEAWQTRWYVDDGDILCHTL